MHQIKAKPRLYITAPRNYLLKQTIKSNNEEHLQNKDEDKLNLKK